MKVGFVSLGCSKNLIDTEVAIGHFKNNKYEIESTMEILSKAGIRMHLGKGALKPETAQALKEKVLAKFPKADVFIEPTGALCSFYAEQGGLLVGFESN